MADPGRHPGMIVVVEDDPDISEIVSGVLRSAGFEVSEAADGQQGLDRVDQIGRPCLVLLDLMMPVLSGGEFLDRFRRNEKYAAVPVVIMSAWAQEAEVVRDQSQGFLRKPFSSRALLETVHRFCAAPRGSTP